MTAVAVSVLPGIQFHLATGEVGTVPLCQFVDGIEILDEVVDYRNGPFCHIRRWLQGAHPELGTLVWGYTGLETLVEKDVIRPLHHFEVIP